MGLYEMKNKEEEIRLKQSKGSLFVGLFLFLLALVLNIGLFFVFGRPPIIIILICMCGIWGSLGLPGAYMLYSYYKLGKGLRAALERYGEDYLIAHVKQSLVKKYSNVIPKSTVYFTDRFVIVPGSAVFEYSSIKRMYRQIDYSGKVAVNCLMFETGDGLSIMTCPCISNEEIIEVMKLCFSYNSNIIMDKHTQGHRVNIEKEEQAVEKFSVPEELTKDANRIRTGKLMMFVGGYMIAAAAGFGLFAVTHMPKSGKPEDFIATACAGGMVVLTLFVIGVVMVIWGKRKIGKRS